MYRRRKYKRRNDIQSAIFWVGIGILWLTNSWWPGIIILIGVSMLVGVMFSEANAIQQSKSAQSKPAVNQENPPNKNKSFTTVEPQLPPKTGVTKLQGLPDWLPDTCDACGAPIEAEEVFWENNKHAICPYCDHLMVKPDIV